MGAKGCAEGLRLVRLCRKQGFECIETSRGYRVLAKDGEQQVTIHLSVSTTGMKNAKAALKKIGVKV